MLMLRVKYSLWFSLFSCSCSQGDFVTHTAWLNRSSILYAGEDKWSVDPRVSLVTLNQDEFTIKIEDVDLTDEGQYICAVQTSSRPRTTSVHIIVQGEFSDVSRCRALRVNAFIRFCKGALHPKLKYCHHLLTLASL